MMKYNDMGMVRCKEDLIRGLEVCQSGDCYHCPYEDIGCSQVLAYDALILLRDKDSERHGRWIDMNPESIMNPRMRCSVCGQIYLPLARWNFCPNCGAKIDKDVDVIINEDKEL